MNSMASFSRTNIKSEHFFSIAVTLTALSFSGVMPSQRITVGDVYILAPLTSKRCCPKYQYCLFTAHMIGSLQCGYSQPSLSSPIKSSSSKNTGRGETPKAPSALLVFSSTPPVCLSHVILYTWTLSFVSDRIPVSEYFFCFLFSIMTKRKCVGFSAAHPTHRGLRIALIVRTDNVESPRVVYIEPTRGHAIHRYGNPRQGIQYTYREHPLLSCPLTIKCKLRSYDVSKTSVKQTLFSIKPTSKSPSLNMTSQSNAMQI